MNIQLGDWLTPAVIPSVIALLGTLAVFGLGERARAKNARNERRRQSVERMLDELDSFVRAETSPLIVKLYAKSDVKLMLAQHRLLMDIPKADTDLWIWMNARVQKLAAGKSTRLRAQIAAEMAGAITEWYRGNLKADWFAKKNTTEGNHL